MFEVFFGAVFMGLVLLGVMSVSYMIMFRMLVPKKKYDYYIVIKSDTCEKEVTEAAYCAKMKINLIGDEGCGKVLVVDTGMSETQRLSCLNVCRKTNGIYLISKDEFEEILK